MSIKVIDYVSIHIMLIIDTCILKLVNTFIINNYIFKLCFIFYI